jgi:hypothetical protein
MYGEIWEKCCSFGLIPVSIENKETLNCLAKEYFSKPEGNFYKILYFLCLKILIGLFLCFLRVLDSSVLPLTNQLV